MEQTSTIMLIGPTPPPFHGVSVATQMLLDSAVSKQFRICHVELADRRGIHHVDKPDFHDVLLFLRQWFRLLRFLIRERPFLVYLALSQSTIGFLRDSLFIWPSYMCGAKVLVHLHGGNFKGWFKTQNWFMQAYVKAVMQRVDHAIVLGECLRNLFAGLVGQQRISVVPNGIDWPEHKSCAPAFNKTRRYRVLHLSTLNRLKGALVLIHSIPLIIKVRQDIEIVLAGPWSHIDDERDAHSFIEEHRLAEFVSFTGPITTAEHKCGLYESADLFVFPGVQQEGQPLVVLEAMAAGLPVIFTNRGCLRETVIDGETGLETACNDPQHLADRILWSLDHPAEMKAMGVKARHRYNTLFTKDLFVLNMTQVFSRVAGEKP